MATANHLTRNEGQIESESMPTVAPAPTATVRLHLTGMTCAGEAAGLERRMRKLDGIERVTVNPVMEIVYITFYPSRLSPDMIEAAIVGAGYRITSP